MNKENFPSRRDTLKKGLKTVGLAVATSIGLIPKETKAQVNVRPFPGRIMTLVEARKNFKMFPEKINNPTKGKLIVVSRKWQMGCLYDESGVPVKVNKENYCFQAGTGELEITRRRNTKLGLYRIDKKEDHTYKSHGTSDGEAKGAPMPWALKMHKKFIKNEKVEEKRYEGDSFHARPSTITDTYLSPFRSHGCIGTNDKIAVDLNRNNKVKVNDHILVVDDFDVLQQGLSEFELVKKLDEQESTRDFVGETMNYGKVEVDNGNWSNGKHIKDKAKSRAEFEGTDQEYLEYILKRMRDQNPVKQQ